MIVLRAELKSKAPCTSNCTGTGSLCTSHAGQSEVCWELWGFSELSRPDVKEGGYWRKWPLRWELKDRQARVGRTFQAKKRV